MNLIDPILAELDQEAEITRRLFAIIPEDKLSWRPHSKARSLGELALHIATVQGEVAELAEPDSAEAPTPPENEATSRAQIAEAFEESLKKAKRIIGSTNDERAMADFAITINGEVVMQVPRMGFWRSILLNHYYHHRGQLSAYLRELDLELPSIYGPSADTKPFS